MPAEPRQRLSRRPSATLKREPEDLRLDSAHTRELEHKRSRGKVSCAECRRLKIKCDKQIPCQSCQRRGCASLCPNGSLATGQGTRFVLAATEHLHKRIGKLSDRVRLLEDALAALHSEHSSEPHPLLKDAADQLLVASAAEDTGAGAAPPDPTSQSLIESFGTLSIAEHGISHFFGPTGGSESLLISYSTSTSSVASPESMRDSSSPSTGTPPHDMYLFSRTFPFTPMGPFEEVVDMIKGHLPSWERAVTLCKLYVEHSTWLFHGLMEDQLMDELLPDIFNRAQSNDEATRPHDLSLLFVVFAIGELSEAEPNQARAEHFYQISRAAISLQPMLEKPSMSTIQALHIMSVYNAMSGSDLSTDTSMEMTWSLVSLAAHLSQTIGLHRDSERWNLPPKEVHRRRVLFWNLFLADAWQSLNTGRPPSFSLVYVDCRYPKYDNEQSPAVSFELWQFRFAAEVVSDMISRTLTAEAPTFTTIMELDRKIREFLPPDGFPEPKEGEELGTVLQRTVMEHIRETVLMFVHRSFFAQAIIEEPLNPLKSTYARSFLAEYRASTTILKSVTEQFERSPSTTGKFWNMWTYAFSAAVVFGTVVTRGPKSPLATSALSELDQACSLFSRGSSYSRRAKKALPILIKLNEKARQALQDVSTEDPMLGQHVSMWDSASPLAEDELTIFAGRTRFVSARKAMKEETDAGPYAPESMMGTLDGHAYATAGPSAPSAPSWQPQYEYDYQPPMTAPYGYHPQAYDPPPASVYPVTGLADMGQAFREVEMDPRWHSAQAGWAPPPGQERMMGELGPNMGQPGMGHYRHHQ
ncbi:hypothetical protein CYLTODRAFT_495190 [Cylindrobasidium torrendii FP15055 ss-10]|uniref:Zn(2)-C6 fungal-type domain-containing protein n=1 Tax=Cylindrobasidium torrendii FP15055 ss-10 TaxID=1314674 RepID=A0A0D7AWB4_9AGAR|nr:hypothetical protein CYLTODRAFT_495190 [Cylindrobasidium torrendii FP15055 ss-10]